MKNVQDGQINNSHCTYGLNSEGTCVPGHNGHTWAQLIGCRLQSHPVDCGGADNQHLHYAVGELPPKKTTSGREFKLLRLRKHYQILEEH